MSGEIMATARGHLAADAVVKLASSGQEVAELRLAVGVRRKDAAGEWVDHHTDWVDVSAWASLVGPASTLRKGELVEVTGPLTPDAYLASDGTARSSTRMTARTISRPVRSPKPQPTPTAGK